MKTDSGLTCEAYMWITNGRQLLWDDETAFRYKVSKDGMAIGEIFADRARNHPDVKWKRSDVREGKRVDIPGEYETIEEALAAF